MTLMNPNERIRTGARTQTEVVAAPAPEPTTLLESTWRDYIFAEVWNRPGLDARSRYWIAMAGAAGAHCEPQILEGYVRGALASKLVTLEEVREAVLHFAVYEGWEKGSFFDRAVTNAANALGLPPAKYQIARPEPWDPEARNAVGGVNFAEIMVTPSPPNETAYYEGGILSFVFGEMWRRPGLDQRARRWVTLVGVVDAAQEIPIKSHVWAAVASRDATPQEMEEFVLQYAIHGGWPKASFLQMTVLEANQRYRDSQTAKA